MLAQLFQVGDVVAAGQMVQHVGSRVCVYNDACAVVVGALSDCH
jgi:hypothetical protein